MIANRHPVGYPVSFEASFSTGFSWNVVMSASFFSSRPFEVRTTRILTPVILYLSPFPDIALAELRRGWCPV
jgi:hypothetical protein